MMRIVFMSEPDNDGERAFIIEHDGRTFSTILQPNGDARTFGSEVPKEILALAHIEMALAHEFEGLVSYDDERFQGIDAFLSHLAPPMAVSSE